MYMPISSIKYRIFCKYFVNLLGRARPHAARKLCFRSETESGDKKSSQGNLFYFKKTDVHAAGFQFEGFPSSSTPQALLGDDTLIPKQHRNFVNIQVWRARPHADRKLCFRSEYGYIFIASSAVIYSSVGINSLSCFLPSNTHLPSL